MIILAIIFLLIGLAMAFLVIGANGMSDAPSQGFQGASLFIVPLLIAAAFFSIWFFRIDLSFLFSLRR